MKKMEAHVLTFLPALGPVIGLIAGYVQQVFTTRHYIALSSCQSQVMGNAHLTFDKPIKDIKDLSEGNVVILFEDNTVYYQPLPDDVNLDIIEPLQGRFLAIYTNRKIVAALLIDGCIVCWGCSEESACPRLVDNVAHVWCEYPSIIVQLYNGELREISEEFGSPIDGLPDCKIVKIDNIWNSCIVDYGGLLQSRGRVSSSHGLNYFLKRNPGRTFYSPYRIIVLTDGGDVLSINSVWYAMRVYVPIKHIYPRRFDILIESPDGKVYQLINSYLESERFLCDGGVKTMCECDGTFAILSNTGVVYTDHSELPLLHGVKTLHSTRSKFVAMTDVGIYIWGDEYEFTPCRNCNVYTTDNRIFLVFDGKIIKIIAD